MRVKGWGGEGVGVGGEGGGGEQAQQGDYTLPRPPRWIACGQAVVGGNIPDRGIVQKTVSGV